VAGFENQREISAKELPKAWQAMEMKAKVTMIISLRFFCKIYITLRSNLSTLRKLQKKFAHGLFLQG